MVFHENHLQLIHKKCQPSFSPENDDIGHLHFKGFFSI